ncbi:MAG TPA: 4-oxalocrotonate tautomerase [Gammaproteobacteria bacterium]|nr:4-oxalocrotonate tautomerase [Gammaproteobacteria bacterium]
MPILDVKIAARESTDLTQAVASSLIELTSRILKKKPEVTSIAITYVDPARWIVGGRPLSEQGKNSFYFDIKITDETNTKAEKAQYIRETYAMFRRLLGELHEVSYVYVEDVRATAYGYGGLTQEYRYQR